MLHPLLIRQLRRCGIEETSRPPDGGAWSALIDRISKTYKEADDERYLIERSLNTSSAELMDLNASLRSSQGELSSERDRLQAIFASVGAGLLVLDHAGACVLMNPAAEKILGWSPERLAGTKVNQLIAGLSSLSELQHAQQQNDDARMVRADGSTVPVSYKITAIEREGQLQGYVLVFDDISVLKDGEIALRRVNEVQEEMGRIARVGGWEYEPATGKSTWTREMYEIFDLPVTHEPRLDSSLDCFPGDAREHVARLVQRAIDTGDGFDYTVPFVSARGRHLWVRGLGKVERRADGTVRLYGALQDVTETHLTNLDLAKARDAAEAASRAKSEFLANMSHEIRTPMTAILGYADLLMDEGDLAKAPPERVEIIDTIRGAGEHLLSVINDILDLSKIEMDKMTIESVPVAITALLQEIVRLVRPQAAEKGVSLSLRTHSSVPARIRGDPTRVRQILMNLVGNAIKFTNEGSITITARVAKGDGGATLTVEVEDTGCGLAPEQAERLFAVFTQADNSMTRKFGGTGLGLVISRRLARLMSGDVSLVRTGVGEGATFRCELPCMPVLEVMSKAGTEEADVEPRSILPASLPYRVLLAEDNPVNRRLIALHLKRAGADVSVAENGRIALEMIESAEAAGREYELLVSDMQMPEMDGYTLARVLRDRGSALPIVALTAHTMSEDRARCLASGCNDYAAKPIDSAALVAVCARWVGKQRREQAPSVNLLQSERSP
jgi:PAS domain S-box-containing protein